MSLLLSSCQVAYSQLLNIPEVVERIVSYLDLSNRLTTRLVCKQWYAASRRLFNIQARWQEHPVLSNQHHILSYLPSLDELSYVLTKKDYDHLPAVQVAWTRLRRQIWSGRATGLHTLRIAGPVNVQSRIESLLPYMTSLASVHLQSVCPEDYTVALFLDGCPQLREISIRFGPQTRSRTIQAVQAGNIQGPYKLNSLTLVELTIAQDSVEAIVAGCPNLNTLSLVSLTDPPHANSPDTGALTRARIDKRRLIAHIARSCPGLQHLHCSAAQGQREMISSLSEFDSLISLGLPAQSICPQLITIIQAYSNALTTLVIENAADDHDELSQSLHTFLCTSPDLKHLEAPNIKFDDRLLNLRHSDANNRIWACRGLLSLNISFGLRAQNTLNTRDCSRVIYGYISQVCPRLERLTISRDRIECSLDSGLCLLGGLEQLKSLEIRTRSLSMLHIWDFGWMNNEPTVLQRIINKMSFNESRLQKSLRARYEWLGYEDSRTVERTKLEELGFYLPPCEASSATMNNDGSGGGVRGAFEKSRRSRLPYHRHHRSGSGGSGHSHQSGTNGTDSPRSHSLSRMDFPLRWPVMERIKITQTYDRRHQAQNIQGYLKKVRPDVEIIVM
ncbi:hypothetical protein BGX34_008147 [Mortierella sp. NVP85]|nr:hypothetical protein BGX34_008147 [Mortierella sp. NVP85]